MYPDTHTAQKEYQQPIYTIMEYENNEKIHRRLSFPWSESGPLTPPPILLLIVLILVLFQYNMMIMALYYHYLAHATRTQLTFLSAVSALT